MITREKQIKRDYYLTCFDNLKLNYQKIPKCATTSILNILNKSNVGHSIHSERVIKYITLEEAYLNEYITFTVTRNPYDRAKSMFMDFFYKRKNFGIGGHSDCIKEMMKLRQNPDFTEFLRILSDFDNDYFRDLHFKSQSFYCKHRSMQYFKLETFSKTIGTLHPSLEFNLNLHTTNSRNLEITKEQKLVIEDVYADDFILWDSSI